MVRLLLKNVLVLLKEEGEYWSRNIKSRRKYDSDVSDSHLVLIRMVDDVDEEGSQVSKERVIS
jgi:hypothetical protein